MKRPYAIVLILVVIAVLAAGVWYVSQKMHGAFVHVNQGIASSTDRYGMGVRGGFVTGSIEVLNDDGFVLTLPDSSTKDVILSATTTIEDYTSASTTPSAMTSDQLSVGEEVSVIGEPNADGSIEARSVRFGNFPTMRMGGPRPATSTYPRPAAGS